MEPRRRRTTRGWIGLAFALGFIFLTAPADARFICRDGTTSRGGNTPCKHHGGIAKIDPRPDASGSANVDAGGVACKDGTMAAKDEKPPCFGHGGLATDANQTDPTPDTPPRGTGDKTDPANATAQCKDGTFSHAREHAGACANNGGVAKWLDQMPPDGGRPR